MANVASPLLALAQAGADSLVMIGGQLHAVRPPTVREAVEMHTALAGMAADDPDDAERFVHLLERWLPADVMACVREFTAEEAVATAATWLAAGVPQEVSDAPSPAGGGATESPSDLWLSLIDYTNAYGGDAWTNYDRVPWPFFLAALARLDAAAARAALMALEWATVPHMGRGAARQFKSLAARARRMPGVQNPEGDYAPQEVVDRDRAKLRELFGVPHPTPTN